MELEATHLRDNRYAVRPKGALGTCGWINGKAWQVVYVRARNAAEAGCESAEGKQVSERDYDEYLRDSRRWRVTL